MDISRNPSQQSGISTMPLIVFGVLALVFGLGTYIFYPSWGTLPIQASVQAERTDELFRVLMGISAVVFFLVQGLIYYAAIAFRAKANDFTDGPAIHGNVMLEIVWTIVPSVIVVGIALYSFLVWSDNTEVLADNEINVVDGEPLDINVYAQRFGWSFEYITNEEDVEGDIIVLNSLNLHTYVGQNLFLRMETRDVIHSFWVPSMRIKQDLLPERTTEVRVTTIDPEIGWQFGGARSPVTVYTEESADSEIVFEDLTETDTELSIYPNFVELELLDPDAPLEGEWTAVIINGEDGFVATDEILGRYNEFYVVCAELCGSGHGDMGFTSKLLLWETDEAMMDAWYTPEIDANKVPPSGPVDLGRILLSTGQYPCSNCHTLEALGWTGALAPSLDGIGERAADRADTVGEDVISGAEYIAQSIRLPDAYIIAGYNAGVMPQFVTDGSGSVMLQEDLNAIVAYLCTQTASGNPTDSTCNLENLTFDDEGKLEDVDALEAELSDITNEYE